MTLASGLILALACAGQARGAKFRGTAPSEDAIWTSTRAGLTKLGAPPLLQPGQFVHGGHEIRGASASSDLKAGSAVLEIPSWFALSTSSALAKEIFGEATLEDPRETDADGGSRVTGFLKLAAALAVERQLGDKSPWVAYLSHAPSLADFSSFHPLFASKELLNTFAALPVADHVRQNQDLLNQDWDSWKSFAASTNNTHAKRAAIQAVTRDDLNWALAVVVTHGFGDGPELPAALEPLAEDVNMDVPAKANVAWSRDSIGRGRETFQLFTTKPVKKGEELIANYADTDNEALFSHWGVFLSGNQKLVPPLETTKCGNTALKLRARPGWQEPPKAAAGVERKCIPPKGEAQPALFCSFLGLAREYCRGKGGFP